MSITFDRSKCLSCAGCVSVCPKDAITFTDMRPEVDSNCTECGTCVQFCPVGAISIKKE